MAKNDQMPLLSSAEKISETPPTEKKIDTSKKTTGEYAYDVTQFLTGKVFILAITAVLAYIAHPQYGADKYFGVTNPLKKFSQWLEKTLKPLETSGRPGKIAASALMGMALLSHGGNFFAPIIKWLENSRESISNFFNRHIGKPGEEEIAHERLKDLPKQNWADIAIGRVGAWATAFTAFALGDIAAGVDKKTGKPRFAIYEEWFSRKIICKFPGLSKEAKEIANIPLSKEIPKELISNKAYHFGKIAALDIWATTLGIIAWNFISRKSAKKRATKENELDMLQDQTNSVANASINNLNDDLDSPKQNFSQKIVPSKKSLEASESFAQTINKQHENAAAMAQGI